jgi:chromosome partitioning protein
MKSNTKIISFFNHKGGVGKTTVAHNLATALTREGKNVLLIDADPQMNLTASVLGLADSVEYAESNESKWQNARLRYTNINDYLTWYTTKATRLDQNFPLELYKYVPDSSDPIFQDRGELALLCGDIKLFEIESRLYSIATSLVSKNDGTIYSIEEAVRDLGKNYDYVLIDTSPSASSILNGVFVMMSDYFLAPVFPNFFSLQAIDNLYDVMQNWINLLSSFQVTPNNKGLSFRPKFLGIIINMAKRYNDKNESNKTTIYSQNWKNKLNKSISEFYLKVLDVNRTVTKLEFEKIFENSVPFVIEELCDFTGQIRSVAEISGTPVIDLTQDKVNNAIKKNNSIEGAGQISPIYIKKANSNSKATHYIKAFDDVSKSYAYIAKSIANNL